MTYPIFSPTGVPRGKGSDKYRYVSSLTKLEKQAVLNGKTVLVKCPWTHHLSTPYKEVTAWKTLGGKQYFSHKNYYGKPSKLFSLK